MNSIPDSVRKALILVVLPFGISFLSAYIVHGLLYVGFIYEDGSGVMSRIAAIISDLTTQTAYFAGLIAVTKEYRYVFLLLTYQIVSAFMFLKVGSPNLFVSVVGTVDIVWHELLLRFGLLGS